MSFSRALYYPTIDIGNWDWAKSAALFWDTIQTIVPQSINDPYTSKVTKIMYDEGVLVPLNVNPEMGLIHDLASEVERFLQTNEAFEYLVKGKETFIHKDKLPRELQRIARIHPEKMSSEIRHAISADISEDGWMQVDRRFARFYMSLLANKICDNERLVLLTDDEQASNLTEKARVDNQIQVLKRREYDYKRDERTTLHLSEGLLSNLALRGIKFSPDTDVIDVIRFKRNYQDELGAFRTNLTRLVKDIPKDITFEQLQYQVNDIYINEFLPSYNNLKSALDGSKLKWIADNVMKISFFSTGATALPTMMLGANIPQALIAGAGVSLISSVVSYNVDKTERLRNNPYSFLYSAERQLSKEKFVKAFQRRIF
nr:DUF6236 family protein [uncultured Arsenicibacter sp.]